MVEFSKTRAEQRKIFYDREGTNKFRYFINFPGHSYSLVNQSIHLYCKVDEQISLLFFRSSICPLAHLLFVNITLRVYSEEILVQFCLPKMSEVYSIPLVDYIVENSSRRQLFMPVFGQAFWCYSCLLLFQRVDPQLVILFPKKGLETK